MKDSNWDDADVEIALIAIPNIFPIPFGKEINSNISPTMTSLMKQRAFQTAMVSGLR